MKILIITHEFPPIGGGGANACYYLSKGYVEQGNEVTIVTANYNGLPERETINGVTVIRVNSKRQHRDHCSFAEMASYLVKAFFVANDLVKKEKFDVCQVFFGIPSGPIGYWLKKRYKIPYVIRFGGGDIPGAQDRFALIYKVISPFLKVIWKNADGLIANSEGLRERARGFYDKKPIEIITNGVDTDYFTPSKEGKTDTDEAVNVLFVSRLMEGKGLQFVIPKLKNIMDNSGKKVKLVIVGDGPYREQLEQMAAQSGVESSIFFEGFKNKEEIIRYYQQADIFILPSKREGMPNVVLEAMGCGLPVVMTPCEGAKELIAENGSTAKQEDFAQELERVVKSPELRMQMADCARERAVKEFSWSSTVEKYMEIYRRCV